MKNFKEISAVIVDDEQNSKEKIFNIINSYFKNIKLETAYDVKSGIEVINKIKPQIVFLDIDMPDGTGFDLLNGLNSHNFKVIFITAHQEHALKAIKFSALDYILKPYSSEELIIATNNALNEIETENNQLKIETFLTNFKEENNKAKKLVLNTSDNIYIIDVESIIRCEADNNYTVFYTSNNKKIVMSKTLKEYESLLSNNNFIRIHRSHLININFLDRFEKKNSGKVIMKDNSIVPVSSRKKEQLIQMINQL